MTHAMRLRFPILNQ
ncbi:erythromycin resistance leader peptide [Lysinibacillus sp. HST-98]|nr:erythromycin resistance leader peptide [Lysinibacillus sp. HST-98]MBU5254312.1 erythromycin resistance leader peptide [Lysinibacillus capsici]MBX8945301.1 erythromycin resistance leader peptide [Lysinibacillus sp. K60]QBQ07081.1 hypothetical protein E2C16_06800 [Sporosarcina pasteurii]UNT57740.1 erythromycin resistance leader peptide [Lysinibacillus capsici]